MSKYANAVRVVAAVINREQRFLVCLRPLGKRHGGLWEFPGGKAEIGETNAETVSRELREELGLEVAQVGAPIAQFKDPHSPYVIVFVPTSVVGTPEALEHDAIRWATARELVELPLTPTDRRFVEAVVSSAQASVD